VAPLLGLIEHEDVINKLSELTESLSVGNATGAGYHS
jgi:hypothetical protein